MKFLLQLLAIQIAGFTAEAEFVIKVICPNDEHLRRGITAKMPGDNFLVECSNVPGKYEAPPKTPKPNWDSSTVNFQTQSTKNFHSSFSLLAIRKRGNE